MAKEEAPGSRLLAHLRSLSTRARAGLAALLAALLFLWALPFFLDYESEEAQLTERAPAAKSAAARSARVDVPRAQMASEELRDPFSPLHEKHGEAKAEAAALPAAARAKGTLTPHGSQATAKAASAVPRLTGIILGAEPLATLELGERCEALKAGESMGAYRVERIEAGGALLSSPGGELWLSISR